MGNAVINNQVGIMNYYYETENGPIYVAAPLVSQVQVPVTYAFAATRTSSQDVIELERTFQITYVIQTDQNSGAFNTITITDSILQGSYGVIYGTPVLTSSSFNEPLSNKIQFNGEGTLEILNVYADHHLPEGDEIRIVLPMHITKSSASMILNNGAEVCINLASGNQCVAATLENNMVLETGKLKVSLMCNKAEGEQVVIGEHIVYTFYLLNTRKGMLMIMPEQVLSFVPNGTSFVGWGSTGQGEAPLHFTFTQVGGKAAVTNNDPVYLLSGQGMRVTYCVSVEGGVAT